MVLRRIKKLSIGLKKRGGRNNQGRTCTFHRGGGHKRSFRLIDNSRHLNLYFDCVILKIEMDPSRSNNIALVLYENGVMSYIFGFEGMFVGQVLPSVSKFNSDDISFLNSGLWLPLSLIPVGKEVHNIEKYPYKGAQFLRAAGVSGIVIKKNEYNATIKMPSGYLIKVSTKCFAVLGQSANKFHYLQKLKKAGSSRFLGRRPVVRGVAMNPIDHPHGGGEGKSSGGRPSVSPWGRLTKGQPTVRKKKAQKLE